MQYRPPIDPSSQQHPHNPPHTGPLLPLAATLLSLLLLLLLVTATAAADVMRLDAGNFELAVSTYPALAILFHYPRQGPRHAAAVETWEQVIVC